MSGMKRAVEISKSVLIAALAASALLLGMRTGLFNDFFRTIPFFGNVAELMIGGAGAAETGGAALKEAARPILIVITNEDGGHYAVKYDTDARNAVYDRTSSILSEALGSVSGLAEVAEDEWRAALSGPGIYFMYAAPVGLSVLDGWLGAQMPENQGGASLRQICVAFGGDRSRIYFSGGGGQFYGADTASSAGKAQELGIYSANGAMFAFETDLASAAAPYMLITTERGHPDVYADSAGNQEELLGITLDALEYGDQSSAILPESDGAMLCVGTQFNIRLDAQGRLLYHSRESLPPAEERQTPGESEMIERARVIAAQTIGETCGAAEVFFESIEYNAGYCTVCFGYYIAGGRVYLRDDARAAGVTFFSGVVTDVELNFRNFTFTGEDTVLMPERQAFAAAGGEFILCYADSGAELMQPFWH